MSKALQITAHLSPKEKRALLARLIQERGERSVTPPSAPRCAHHLFEAQARRVPASVAIVASEGQLTYAQLDERANRIAHRLRELGVGPDVLVGLCVERSLDLVAAFLGVLKAGGAYVPLDPNYPAERLSYMAQDAGLGVLLTSVSTRGVVTESGAAELCLDEVVEGSSESVSVSVGGENLAYVIYTSGSTGRPKGVEIPHGALVNFLESMSREPGLTERDVLLAVTTLSFDIAALELLLPLVCGARIVLVDRGVSSDGSELSRVLGESGATVMQATPATWRLLLGAGWSGDAGLKILCGGEAMARDLAEELLSRSGSLWNMYGPTETTVWSSLSRVESGSGAVPIGRPVAQTQLYVLDSRLRPVPVGVTGELYIGGAGLARGYRNRSGLTSERFLPDPFGGQQGGRIYRTGDLARYRPDGQLECLGRVDHQVKIRGYRIEPGEIEQALRKHPEVREAVVLAREDTPGDRRLVAYVVTASEILTADLWAWLKERLPEYMVPGVFVVLDVLPLTPSGKVDRQALPAPELIGHAPGVEHVAPRGPVEEALAGIWGAVLGADRVGAEDNFFLLGGHSLKATQLLSRVRDSFGVELPLRSLFEAPTVAGLARRLEEAMQAGPGLQAPPLTPIDRDGPLPASFAQQRLWFIDQLDPGNQAYIVPRAVRLVGKLDLQALEQVFNEVIRRHESLRTTFTSSNGVPVAVVTPKLALRLDIEDLTTLPEPAREPEAMRRSVEEARKPFDLAGGPLIRVRLLRLASDEYLMLLTMHHIISDDWSIGVLIREVTTLYEAFSQGLPTPLPEMATQYVDFAAWQRQWMQGDVLKAHLDHWKKQLTGAPPLELPIDRPRPAVLGHKGGKCIAVYPKALAESVHELSRQEGATLFMTLLAAYQTLLFRYTRQEDFAVGSPIAGRSRSETESMIGFFINTLVLRADLSANPSFREVLRRVRQTALAAYPYQELPFDQLIGVLMPKRDPSRTPLFQVMFAIQNAPMPTLKLPNLTLTRLPAEHGMAQFELTLNMLETEQGFVTALEYNADLFNADTIERMLEHFRILLEGIVANPAHPIATLPMLTEAERRQVLGQWNQTTVEPVAPRKGDSAVDATDLDKLSDEELTALLRKLKS